MQDHRTPIDATEEQWLPVVGYEGVYSVSNAGRVRRDLAGRGTRSGTILKMKPTNTGYPRVGLVRNGIQETHAVHRLVAQAFLGERPSGSCVNHIDGDKTNNVDTNLEYGSYSHNNLHAFETGLKKPTPGLAGSSNANARLTEPQVRDIRNSCDSNADCGRRHGISRQHVRRLRNGDGWRHVA